jgi:hypothetical protein
MGIGVSLLLIAVGAVLTWAVTATTSGIDVNTVGVILMVVGAVGLLLSLLFWSTWWGPGYFRSYQGGGYQGGGPARRIRRRAVAAPDDRREVEEVVEEERY